MNITVPTRATSGLEDLDVFVREPADSKVLGAVAVGGVLFDLAMRSGVLGLAGTLGLLFAAGALVLTGRVRTFEAKALAVASMPFAIFLSIRASGWLIGPDILAAVGLLFLAASASRGSGRALLNLTLPRLVLRAAAAAYHVLGAPGFLLTARGASADQGTRDSAAAAGVRGALLAVPLLLLLGLLLASADAVFASVFRLPDDLVLHAVLVVLGAWLVGGLLRTASVDAVPDLPPGADNPTAEAQPVRRLGRTEANVVLGSLVGLFGAFSGAQIVAAAGGADHVLQQRGLTYADYARSGFFQLLAVAAITLVTLLALNAVADLRSSTATLVLAEAAVTLTLSIVGVALHRLSLYEDAYGLTMLRLYSQVFAVWIALSFVALGVVIAMHARWFLAASAGAGLTLLLLLNAVNPEALVVRRNVGRPNLDTVYLTRLSDDAVPALHVARIGPIPCKETEFRGWAAANLARSRAMAVRNQAGVCQP